MEIKDLDFKTHKSSPDGKQAKVTFPNGYGASVITGEVFYTSETQPYEIAVLDDGSITYNTPVTDDVCGFLTESAANDILKQISELPAK